MTELTPYDPSNPENNKKGSKNRKSRYKTKQNKADKAAIFFIVLASILFSLCALSLLAPVVQFIWVIVGAMILICAVLIAVCFLFLPLLDDGYRGFINKLADSLGNTSMMDTVINLVIDYGHFAMIGALVFYGISLILTIKSGKEENRERFIGIIIMMSISLIALIILLLINYAGLFSGTFGGSEVNPPLSE